MHVRVVTFNGAKNVKGGIDYVRDEVLPALREQKGYAGATASAAKLASRSASDCQSDKTPRTASAWLALAVAPA